MNYSIALFAVSAVAFAQSGLPRPAVTPLHPVSPIGNAVRPFSHPASTFGSNTGWGSVANPGTGHPPNVTPGGFPKTGINGRNVVGGGSRGYYGGALYGGAFAYAYPTYIPGYYDSITANPLDQAQYYPQQYDAYQGGQGDRPTVVIQNFYPSAPQQPAAAPSGPESNMQRYQAPAPTPSDLAVSSGNYYLIALKDHHVYSVLAYWTEGATFHYVTTQNSHNQTPVESIDVDMTKRLNQDPNMNLTASGR